MSVVEICITSEQSYVIWETGLFFFVVCFVSASIEYCFSLKSNKMKQLEVKRNRSSKEIKIHKLVFLIFKSGGRKIDLNHTFGTFDSDQVLKKST